MEAAEETLSYRDDIGPYRKLLHGHKDKCNPETKYDESKYVDLNSEDTKHALVVTGDDNQRTVFKPKSDKSIEVFENIVPYYEKHSKDNWAYKPVSEDPTMTSSFTELNSNADLGNGDRTEIQTKIVPRDYDVPSECEELQYTDMYLNSKSESDDCESVILSDHLVPDIVDDESHYITTHEIQLTELDHDVDYDSGRDNEDDNLVYTFVDYASFESNETTEGTLIVKGRSHAPNNAHQRVTGCAFPSTESELCDSDKFASSVESMCRNQNGSGNMEGQMHLSIKSSSDSINECNNVREKENMCYHAKHVEDRSHFFFTNTDARAEGLCDNRAQYFIPAPGRQHLATKLRGKDVNEYSSGASSSISELDDADKEVRNLTAKSFRSLACPYFDAINLSTSSESSISEYGLGLNQWSAFVDLTYGNLSQSREENVIGHKVATATFERRKADLKNINGMTISNKKGSQPNIFTLNKKMSSPKQTSPSTQNAETTCQFQPAGEVITLTKTLNFRCNVDAVSSERGKRIKCSENAPGSHSKDDITHTMPAKAGYEVSYQQSDAEDSMEGINKKASFASSLLKNVISKKMQIEQERNMEKAEIRDMHPLHSPCFHCKDQVGIRDRCTGNGVYRPISDMGPGYMSNYVDELRVVDIKSDYCDPAERIDALKRLRSINEANLDVPNDICEPTKRSLTHSENSAFKSWKDGEPEPPISYNLSESAIDESVVSSKITKLSHLFVPSSQLLPKDKEFREPVSATTVSGQNEQQWASETTIRSETGGNLENVKWSKAPEIKIHLSVKEDKCNPLNIANMLTPNISYPAKTATDRVPHFTVRDIRDNKCKFQTPFHQVRDVRKLVKSSYRLVSVDNSGSKGTAAPAAELREDNTSFNKDHEKNTPPISVVIKCQSVNTNSSDKQRGLVTETTKQKQFENDRSFPKPSQESDKKEPMTLYRTRARPPLGFPKQPNADESEAKYKGNERKTESKIPKQAALEKLKAAVKTMEELYVFDRNEWKRKSQAPRPIEDSHVLSFIASEKHDSSEETVAADGCERLCTEINTDRCPKTYNFQEKEGSLRIIHVPLKTQSEQSKTFSNKRVFHVGNNIKTDVNSSGSCVIDGTKRCPPSQMKSMDENTTSNTQKVPLCLKTYPQKQALSDWGMYNNNPTTETLPQPIKSVNPHSENYLTIPVESGCVGKLTLQSNSFKVLGVKPGDSEPSISDSKGLEQHSRPSKKQSPELQYADTANIYQHSLPVATQGSQHLQVFSYSPSVSLLPTTPPVEDPFQPTQRKMLLDPTTGLYYLVDTPVLPATRRLFDPESGQYVDVPMPQPLPVNSVPMSPMALSPGGAYKPTYMMYPGFLSPKLAAYLMAAHQVGSQVPPPLVDEDKSGEKAHGKYTLGRVVEQECNMTESESPYYRPTGGSLPSSVPFTMGHQLGSVVVSRQKTPVISITSQQSPRIIAPPSFDGTTMSFVVEH